MEARNSIANMSPVIEFTQTVAICEVILNPITIVINVQNSMSLTRTWENIRSNTIQIHTWNIENSTFQTNILARCMHIMQFNTQSTKTSKLSTFFLWTIKKGKVIIWSVLTSNKTSEIQTFGAFTYFIIVWRRERHKVFCTFFCYVIFFALLCLLYPICHAWWW